MFLIGIFVFLILIKKLKYCNTMKTVRLITCIDAFQAHLLQGALQNEGIESILHNENLSSVMRGCTTSLSGVDLFVFEDDYERAIQILRENKSLPEELKCCPYCGSKRIRLKLRTGGKIKTAFAVVASMLTGVPWENEHWEYVCKQCKGTFENPVATEVKKKEEVKL